MKYYNNNSYIREIPDEKLYTSKEELQRAAMDENIEIDWAMWRYHVNRVRKQLASNKRPHYGGKPVRQIVQTDINGNIIKKYNRMCDVVAYGFNTGMVCQCCNGKLKQHKGFLWQYEK